MPGYGRRGGGGHRVDVWPGWVDALSALLMVVVFLLMVFVLSQFYLSNALQGRDREVARLSAQVAQLADQLALERDAAAQIRLNLAAAEERLRATLAEADLLRTDVAALGRLAEQQATDLATASDQSAAALAREDLLTQQLAALQAQMAQLLAALDAAETKAAEQESQIVELGKRLNTALAGKVVELARYRSEFFGRLREALGDRDDVRVVGDRFVFQSEVLFDSGSADLGTAGEASLDRLASTLKDVAARAPPDLNWILRVDGHTDRVPIKSPRYPTNWELSTARATEVVRYLIEQGIPPERLAATGFGEFQPLEDGTNPAARARNRRIEIKLDSR